MYKIEFYVPQDHLDPVKSAIFETGAGKIGNYEHCCWQVEGTGQFRPSNNSDPFIGIEGELEVLKEWKVELVCKENIIVEVIKALIRTHPYEEPAYNIVKVMDKSVFL